MNKLAPLAALLLVAGWASSAAAQQGAYVLPPKEFDKPYTGKMVIINAQDQRQIRAACPDVKFPVGPAFGCMTFKDGLCTVVIGPLADLKAAGIAPALVLRHEMGHCNGWQADHKGARKFVEWVSED